MPTYAEPAGRIGAALGGTAGATGGGLLSHLGSLLEPLDYPRQALYNLARSAGRAVSGDATMDDLWSAIPGIVGGAATVATGGLGTPLAMLLGSAAGGAFQGAMKSKDEGRVDEQGNPLENRFEAAKPDDLVRALGGDPDSFPGAVASFGVGAVTDPLSYAGGLGGGKLGATAGKAAGEAAGSQMLRATGTMAPQHLAETRMLRPWAGGNPQLEAGLNLLKPAQPIPWMSETIPANAKQLGAADLAAIAKAKKPEVIPAGDLMREALGGAVDSRAPTIPGMPAGGGRLDELAAQLERLGGDIGAPSQVPGRPTFNPETSERPSVLRETQISRGLYGEPHERTLMGGGRHRPHPNEGVIPDVPPIRPTLGAGTPLIEHLEAMPPGFLQKDANFALHDALIERGVPTDLVREMVASPPPYTPFGFSQTVPHHMYFNSLADMTTRGVPLGEAMDRLAVLFRNHGYK